MKLIRNWFIAMLPITFVILMYKIHPYDSYNKGIDLFNLSIILFGVIDIYLFSTSKTESKILFFGLSIGLLYRIKHGLLTSPDMHFTDGILYTFCIYRCLRFMFTYIGFRIFIQDDRYKYQSLMFIACAFFLIIIQPTRCYRGSRAERNKRACLSNCKYLLKIQKKYQIDARIKIDNYQRLVGKDVLYSAPECYIERNAKDSYFYHKSVNRICCKYHGCHHENH